MTNFLLPPDSDALDYRATRWQRMLYDARTNAGALVDARRAVAGSLTGAARTDGTAINAETATAIDETAATFGGEVFARLYGDPAAVDNPAAGWTTRAQEMLDALPEWSALRESVAGDPDFAALAAASVMNAIAPNLAGMIDETNNDGDGDGDGDGSGDGNGAPGAGRSRRPGAGVPSSSARVRAAMRRACRDAAADVAEMRAGLAGLAPGLDHAPPANEQPDASRMALAERLRNDARLRDLLARAGRIERMASANDSQTTAGTDEIVDIERGGDVSRLIPSELARMACGGAVELLALRDLVERNALCYKYVGREPVGRGDMVVLLDESASMSGDAHTWARAIGIAATSVAAREHRAITVAGFDTRPRSVHRVDAGGACSINGNPARNVADVVLSVASQSLGGGTDLGAILDWAVSSVLSDDDGSVSDRADVVIVTDGRDTIPDSVIERLTAARDESGVRVFGLTVNGGSLSPTLAAVCVDVVDIDAADDPAASIANLGWSA